MMMRKAPWWEGLPGTEDVTDELLEADYLARWQAHRAAVTKEKQSKAKSGLTQEQLFEAWLAESGRTLDDALTTGWPTVDSELGRPILPGEVVIVGARTGVGKTWVVQHLGERAVASEGDHHVAFVSMEMSSWQLGERFAAHVLGVNPTEASRRARAGELTAPELLREGHDRWWFYDHSIAVAEMGDVVESAAEAMGAPPTIIVLDYLGLLAGKGKLYERTSDNARALKEAAKETNTIILCVSQISREIGGSGEQEPSLAGMRDSGAIEEAADRALLFWGVHDAPDEIYCRIAKNRYGEKGSKVLLRFDGAMRLEEVDELDAYALDRYSGDGIPF